MALNCAFRDGCESLSVGVDITQFSQAVNRAFTGEQSNPLLERLMPKIEDIDLPSGYSLEWHGEYKDSNESSEGLAILAPYGFTAMILAVVVMFNGLRQPLVIWLNAPLAIIGVTVGLVILQVPFEFMAILGCLSLVGCW